MPHDFDLMSGQRLILGFDGLHFNNTLEHYISTYKVAGLILFAANIDTPEQVAELTKKCQQTAARAGLPPLFICADQEGGTVARFREHFTLFDGNPAIKSLEDAEQFASTTAKELAAVGINLNFAPVMDIADGTPDSIMAARSFPGDARSVSTLGCRVIRTLQNQGMMAVAKHFPGIGRTVLDSHFHLPSLDVALETLEKSDLVPFKAAIQEEVSGIMLSHIHYPQLDNELQASLSKKIAHTLLRETLKYDGLVFTDDLDMKAIKMDIRTCIQKILEAGIDISLICHTGPNIQKARDHILYLLKNDEALFRSGQRSLQRILSVKKKYL